jgi:hypothetical protein
MARMLVTTFSRGACSRGVRALPFSCDETMVYIMECFAQEERWFVNKLLLSYHVQIVKSLPMGARGWWPIYISYLSSFFVDFYGTHSMFVNVANETRDRELRLFITKGQLLAISQRDTTQSFAFMNTVVAKNYAQIWLNCQSFWKRLQAAGLFFPACLVDVIIDDFLIPRLVEISPSHAWTGACSCLFDWEVDPPQYQQIRIVIPGE